MSPKRKFPAPTRDDHDTFCRREGWTEVRRVDHHLTYELSLANGDLLRTRISRPPDRTTYGPSMWAHILRDQLGVTATEFWACVQDGLVPERSRQVPERSSIPLDVVLQLRDRVGLTEDEIRSLSRDEALARLERHWSQEQ